MPAIDRDRHRRNSGLAEHVGGELARGACSTRIMTVIDAAVHPESLPGTGRKVAVQEHERYLFEAAREHSQTKRMFDNYANRNTFFAPGDNIRVNAALEDYEEAPSRAIRSSSCRRRATRWDPAHRWPRSTGALSRSRAI